MSGFLLLSFAFITLIASLLVITAINPVHSVLFLVVVFLGTAGMLFLLELEFIPLTFIIVYVGAIAILFLFVVMMLDIKIASKSTDFFKYLPIGCLVGGGFFFETFCLLEANLTVPSNLSLSSNNFSWFYIVDKVSNIEALGQLLYTNYFIFFLISGIILLVAMIGAIVLTLQFNKNVKNQLIFRQLSRSSNNAVFLVQN